MKTPLSRLVPWILRYPFRWIFFRWLCAHCNRWVGGDRLFCETCLPRVVERDRVERLAALKSDQAQAAKQERKQARRRRK